jgi:hypothetical protein
MFGFVSFVRFVAKEQALRALRFKKVSALYASHAI